MGQESITRMYVNRAQVKNLYAQADEIISVGFVKQGDHFKSAG